MTTKINVTSSLLDGCWQELVDHVAVDYPKWLFSITGCVLVGLSGIFPLILFRPCSIKEEHQTHSQTDSPSASSQGINGRELKRLLNFAVGSLLGDVFLHLLPEAWHQVQETGVGKHKSLIFLGFWVVLGIISFVICEKLVTLANEEEGSSGDFSSQVTISNNNVEKLSAQETIVDKPKSQKQLAGYLNLLANGFDNFTHGLAVAGSFVISTRIGLLTTAAILLHEIPHEIADFAILLRAGFNPWSAAKAQLSTALVGIFGALFTLSANSIHAGKVTLWILPFTSGCFINIALTNLLPELVKEKEPVEAVKHLMCMLIGIGIMACVSTMES